MNYEGKENLEINDDLDIRKFIAKPDIVPLFNIKSPYKIGDAFKVGTTIMAH